MIQNALDCLYFKQPNLNIKIKSNKTLKTVSFSHNSKYFSNKDVVSLIQGISDKEYQELHLKEKKSNIGRFGKGFYLISFLS